MRVLGFLLICGAVLAFIVFPAFTFRARLAKCWAEYKRITFRPTAEEWKDRQW